MSTGSMNRPVSREQLSALADGELDADAVAEACAGWYADPSERAAWHAYHLIGDVMRSEDLASDSARDADFLASLRDRLAREPVVLAPAAPAVAVLAPPDLAAVAVQSAGARRGLRFWRAPAAVAAGFVAVAGVLVVMRGGAPAPAPQLASVTPPAVRPASPVVPVSTHPSVPEPPPDPQAQVADVQVIRDARLDRYLAAHKQFAGSSALGVPSAFLRSATADASSR